MSPKSYVLSRNKANIRVCGVSTIVAPAGARKQNIVNDKVMSCRPFSGCDYICSSAVDVVTRSSCIVNSFKRYTTPMIDDMQFCVGLKIVTNWSNCHQLSISNVMIDILSAFELMLGPK